MAYFNSSNVSIHGGMYTINNGDPEFGMHDFMFVQKRILIDDFMKDLIP